MRKLCPGTGKRLPVEGSLKTMIEQEFADLPEKYRKQFKLGDAVYEIEPTEACPKGTKGRTAVFEVLEVNDGLARAILSSAPEPELVGLARAQGMLTMKEDALLKAFAKEIPFEEVTTLGGLDEVADVAETADAGEAEER